MKILKTKFKGLLIFKSKNFYDKRGYFRELVLEKKIKMLSVKEERELKKIEKKEESFFFFFSFFIFLILGAVSIVVYYFNNTSLNIISETKGIVVPSSKVKVIQHLEGGIIKKIYANIGDIVKKNDILLELEPVKTLADFSEIEKEYADKT